MNDVLRVVLEPTPAELLFHRDQYDALVAALEAEGYEVELVQPVEQRGGLPEPLAIADLLVRVVTGIVAANKLAEIVRERLRPRRGPHTRRGEVHLPNGEVHQFDIPDE